MTAAKLGRRRFVRATGLAALALPFLRAARTRGQTLSFPKRLVVFAVPNGTRIENFWPAGRTFAETRILAPLSAFEPKSIVIRGLDMRSAAVEPVPRDHWPDNYNMLTARQAIEIDGGFHPGGVSVDQHVADRMTTPLKSLQLGVQGSSYCGTISSRVEGGRAFGLAVQDNPFDLAADLFADVAGDPLGYERLRAERQSVIDVVRADLGDLACKLDRSDRYKLDAHLTAIRDIELSLDSLRSACAPFDPGARFSLTDERFPEIGDLQMRLAVAALACDRTRVITMLWSNGSSTLEHAWADVPYSHHGISHNSEGVSEPVDVRHEWLTRVSEWYAAELAKLLRGLDAIPEGDGTMLDNSAVLWAHEQADGATHQRTDMPYVLVGSCGGYFRTGRAIDFGGVAHNGLLVSLANAMGVETTDFGDPSFSGGPLSELVA